MSFLVVYKPTGEITQVITGNASSIAANADRVSESHLITDEEVNHRTHYVNLDDLSVKPKGDQPSDSYVFDYSLGQWILDLDLAKSIKWSVIKIARDDQEFGTFDWSGRTFQCDEVSQRRIQGAVQLAAIDSTMTLDWTLADNTVESFTAQQYIQIGRALAAHVSQTHARGRILRLEIDASTTLEDLEAIVW